MAYIFCGEYSPLTIELGFKNILSDNNDIFKIF